MKKQLFILFILLALVFACSKDNNDENLQLNNDIALIEQHLAEKNIQANKLQSGLYYLIHRQGSDVKPTLNSTVTVSYTGKLLNDNTFDSGDFVSFPLRNLIKGWQQGLPLIGSNGRITLFVPSPLGYGRVAQPGIPANSVLIFDITLHYFSN